MRKAHDNLEKFFALRSGFRDGHGTESLQVASDAVLLLDGEANPNEGLEEVDGVNRGDIKFISLFPPDAANADAARSSVLRCHWLKLCMDGAVALRPFEFDESSTSFLFIVGPVNLHGLKVPLELEIGLESGQ